MDDSVIENLNDSQKIETITPVKRLSQKIHRKNSMKIKLKKNKFNKKLSKISEKSLN
jgi:hypothetical protein